jgi:hypothetical protein
MSGGTLLGVVQPAQPHKCVPPSDNQPTWQVWRCDCGFAWRLEPRRGLCAWGHKWYRHYIGDILPEPLTPPPGTAGDSGANDPTIGRRGRPGYHDAILGRRGDHDA